MRSRRVISLRTLSPRGVSQLTGRRGSLSVCTRAKGCSEKRQLQGLEVDRLSYEGVGVCERIKIQRGFMLGHGTSDAILVVCQL